MARGWESKSVEQQLDEAEAARSAKRERLTPEQIARSRRVDELKLSRARVVQQLEASRNERYSTMLRQQIEAIDAALSAVEQEIGNHKP